MNEALNGEAWDLAVGKENDMVCMVQSTLLVTT